MPSAMLQGGRVMSAAIAQLPIVPSVEIKLPECLPNKP